MIHINKPFPAIKGNPTTNYVILPSDEAKEKAQILIAKDTGDWPPHERYIGELETRL